jgi:hypothetical protein
VALPDYRLVPTHRSLVINSQDYDLWEKYGNDHDGPQAEFCTPGEIGGRRVGTDVPLSQEQFEWWWNRNKWHNWCFIVKRQRVINPTYVWGKPKGEDFQAEVNNNFVLRYNPFFVKVGPLYAGYRSDKPAWPFPADSRWFELGPGGGALEYAGFKFLSWAPLPAPPTSETG